MDDPKSVLSVQEYLYQENEPKTPNNNSSALEKTQIKGQKDLSNEILYFSINQDSKWVRL